jgi:hypothetical protein
MEDRTVVAHSLKKTKNLICGMEGENAAAYDRLPSSTPPTTIILLLNICFRFLNLLLCLNFDF